MRAVVVLLALAGTAHAGDDRPRPHPTLVWLATQLLPSPGLAIGDGGTSLDLRWQVTPVLYSFAVNHRISPWRFGIAEPFARYGGSVELYVSPELVQRDLSVRPGVRLYVPVHERGESMSASLGIADQRAFGKNAVAIEAGLYIAFGIVGVQASYAPVPSSPAKLVLTLCVRYF